MSLTRRGLCVWQGGTAGERAGMFREIIAGACCCPVLCYGHCTTDTLPWVLYYGYRAMHTVLRARCALPAVCCAAVAMQLRECFYALAARCSARQLTRYARLRTQPHGAVHWLYAMSRG